MHKVRVDYQEAVKKRILEITEQLLSQGGSDQVTIRKIAHHLGMSLGAIYTYFPDKNAILREVYVLSCKELLQELEKSFSRKISPKENYLRMMKLICDFRMKNFYRYKEIYHVVQSDEPQELQAIRHHVRQRLLELEIAAFEEERVLRQAEKTLLALCEGMMSISYEKACDKKFYEDTLEFALLSLLSGWKSKK